MSEHNLDIPVTTTVHAPSSDGVELDELASDEATPPYPHHTMATINATISKQKHHNTNNSNNSNTSQQIRNNNGKLTDPDIPVPSSHLHENDTDRFGQPHPYLGMNINAVATVFPPTASSISNGASGSYAAPIMNKRQQNIRKKRKTDDGSETSLHLLEAVSNAISLTKESK